MSEPVTRKDLREGDKIELTSRWTVTKPGPFSGMRFLDAGGNLWAFDDATLDAATIKRLPKEIKVGDTVLIGADRFSAYEGRVIGINEGLWAWIYIRPGHYGVERISELQHVPSDDKP